MRTAHLPTVGRGVSSLGWLPSLGGGAVLRGCHPWGGAGGLSIWGGATGSDIMEPPPEQNDRQV